MNENKLKSFLSSGFQSGNSSREAVSVKIPSDSEIAAMNQAKQEPAPADRTQETLEGMRETIQDLRAQIEQLQRTVEGISIDVPDMPDMSSFVTTREQIKSLTTAIDRQNIEITNKALVSSMEQIAIMREDFFKLCNGMENKIDVMSAKDVLNSFKAYEVDMENILTDGGVFIGHFPYETLNTIHQRIVEVVPTDDPEKNGMIAERLSDGYKLGNRVLLKEKVSVYKYTEQSAQQTVSEEPQPAVAEVPPVETPSEGAEAVDAEEPKTENASAEQPEPIKAEAPEDKPTKPVSRKRKTVKAEKKTNKTEEEE